MRESSRPSCVCITGPTACGKTDLALRLAERVPLEVVSMDSAMVYRGLDIGTAKPTPATRARVPHHLIDVLEPTGAYSAGRFADDAAGIIEAISRRGRLPVLVGGTLLYLRALRDGLAALPRADRALRAALDRDAAAHGWPALHARLAAVDPRAAVRIAPTDKQRIQRALEVYTLTGRPITELQRSGRTGQPLRVLSIVLEPPSRAELAVRIEQRFDAMVAAGFVEEVERLRARGDLLPTMPAIRAVGYRQLWAYLAGECDWPAARDNAIAATRQYAKRQLTWLRGEPPGETWNALEPGLLERCLEKLADEGLAAGKN